MKKWMKISSIILGILVLLIVILVLSLDSIIAGSVRVVGSAATGTPVEIRSFSSMLLTGRFSLDQLSVANPAGFQEPQALQFQSLTVQVQPTSLLSDTIVVDEVSIDGLAIDFEPSLTQGSNLNAILKHVEEFCGGTSGSGGAAAEPAPQEPGKKVVIKLVKITNSKITVASKLLASEVTIPLPDITMTDIGEQQSSGEAIRAFLTRLFAAVTQALAASNLKDVGAGIGTAGEDLINQTGQGVTSGVNAIKNLF